MSTDTPARPTQADAQTAMAALGDALLEDVAAPAVGYLQDRLTEHGETPLWGHDTALVVAAVALAVQAYAERTESSPVAAWWDNATTRDENGVTWVMCVAADTGRPIALALDEEHAEALAGALLDTEDGEQVPPAGLEDAIAAATEAVRDAATAEIATRDARIRELEAEVAILQAADVDPDDTLLTGIGGIPGEGTEIRLRPPEELMKVMVASMVAMLNGAQNYVELELRAAGDPEKYLVRVQRAKGKTPNTLREEAEQRARAAEARATELEEALKRATSLHHPGPEGDYDDECMECGSRWPCATKKATSKALAQEATDG
ncbi:hypothetical protein ABZ249_25450 [Nocardiopsis sp. NPDC006139]|uniref:hypothetical protein n=1 Tax=Nocardiopsis sp. NPDC006139 TaxID=3154578 RepID=UPI0033AD0758